MEELEKVGEVLGFIDFEMKASKGLAMVWKMWLGLCCAMFVVVLCVS